MSERYAREYVCPDPAEHGEIAYVPGLLRGDWRTGRQAWTPVAKIPSCPICGATMIHDVDPPSLGVRIVLIHRDELRASA
jgi:hypothetical protein